MKRLGRPRRLAVAALAALGALAIPGTAGAMVRSTHITQPSSNPSYINESGDDVVNGTPTRFHIAGTADADPGDTVRLACLGDGTVRTIVDNVPVIGGAFSTAAVPDADHPQDPQVNTLNDGTCTLRALPETFGGTDVSKFPGPIVGWGYLSGNQYSFDSTDNSDPPNTNPYKGRPYDYYVATMTTAGYSDFDSLSSCGVDDMTVWLGGNSFKYPDEYLFYCNGYTWYSGDGETPGISVDNHPAYTAEGIRFIEPNSSQQTKPGLPAFSYTASRDLISGEVTINESDQVAYCMDDNGTPGDTSDDKIVDTMHPTCAYYQPLDVTGKRTITTSHGGIQATLADSWTAASRRTISLLYENDFDGNISAKFAGSPRFETYDQYGTVGPPSAVPTTFYINGDNEFPQGSDKAPQGAITTNTAWDEITWYGQDGFYMAYRNRTIPAGGAFNVSTTYTAGLTQDDVQAAAKPVEDAEGAPAVAITSPASGAVVTTPSVTVAGKATDNIGVASLTLNGAAVALNADGTFSAPVALAAGVNTITALAKDGAGNAAQAAVQVTYTPAAAAKTCKVPKVIKKKLAAAKKAIKKAGCAVGKAKAVKATKKIKAGRVRSQSPAGGKVVPIGTKVSLHVAKKAKPKHKTKK